MCKKLTEWTGDGQIIQEHDKCLSDIIVGDKIEDEYMPASRIKETNSEIKEENSEKRASSTPK
jgi:hypothetical protein